MAHLRVVQAPPVERAPAAITTVGDLLDDLADDLADVLAGALDGGGLMLRIRSRAHQHRNVPLAPRQ